MPPAVQIGACNALAHIAPAVRPAALAPLLPGLYAGLVGLIAGSSEETLNLVLETLAALLRADARAAAKLSNPNLDSNAAAPASAGEPVAARHLPAIAGPVLEAWAANVSDPLISGDSLEVRHRAR